MSKSLLFVPKKQIDDVQCRYVFFFLKKENERIEVVAKADAGF
jgi:hypothetical protein